MIVRMLAVLVMAAIVVAGVLAWTNASYDRFQYASEEAQTIRDLEEWHSAELDDSEVKSDSIVYAVFGAALAAVCGLVCSGTATIPGRVIGLVAGLILGAGTGALAGYVGHLFDRSIQFPNDPMAYWFGRWMAMLGPIAIACAIAAAVSGKRIANDLLEGIVGGLVGAAIAVAIYCFTSGAFTSIENHEYVFPGFFANRVLIFGLASALIGLAIVFRINPKKVDQDSPNSEKHEDK